MLAGDLDCIPVLDTAFGCIHRVHEQFFGELLAQIAYIVEAGVAAALVVDGVELQGVVALDALFEVREGLFVALQGRVVLG